MSINFPKKPSIFDSNVFTNQPIDGPNSGSDSDNNKDGEQGNTEDDAEKYEEKLRRKMLKQNPIFNIQTKEYPDDVNTYNPRYTREERIEYWSQLPPFKKRKIPIELYKRNDDQYLDDTENNEPNSTLHSPYGLASPRNNNNEKKEFLSWLEEQNNLKDDYYYFPKLYIYIFYIIKSVYWDYLTIILYILWLLFIVFLQDLIFTNQIKNNIIVSFESLLITAPLVLIFLIQLVPFFGSLYYIHYCNDLVKYFSIKDFGNWVSIIKY